MTDSADGMIWLSTEYATVGLIVRGGVVVMWPPYARRWVAEVGRDARLLWRQRVRAGAMLLWLPDC